MRSYFLGASRSLRWPVGKSSSVPGTQEEDTDGHSDTHVGGRAGLPNPLGNVDFAPFFTLLKAWSDSAQANWKFPTENRKVTKYDL